jgi:hypothetical protein
MRSLHLAALILTSLAAAVAAGGAAVRAQGPPLEVILVLDRSAYQPGEPIGFTVHVRNPSRTPMSVSFSTSQRFDVLIQSDIALDRWSRGRTFAQALGEQRWGAEETVKFSDTWLPQTTLAPTAIGNTTAQPLGPGVYAMAAEVQAIGVRVVSRPAYVIIGTPVDLAHGCTTFASPFPIDLPASFVAGAVEPSDAIEGLWQQWIPGARYAVFAPQALKPSDLQMVSGSQPLHICMLSPGRILLPTPHLLPGSSLL